MMVCHTLSPRVLGIQHQESLPQKGDVEAKQRRFPNPRTTHFRSMNMPRAEQKFADGFGAGIPKYRKKKPQYIFRRPFYL